MTEYEEQVIKYLKRIYTTLQIIGLILLISVGLSFCSAMGSF